MFFCFVYFSPSRMGCFRTRLHRYSLVDSERLDDTLSSLCTTTDTHRCTSKSLTLLYYYYYYFFFCQHSHAFRQYKHSISVKNKHYVHVKGLESHSHPQKKGRRAMVSRLQATSHHEGVRRNTRGQTVVTGH